MVETPKCRVEFKTDSGCANIDEIQQKKKQLIKIIPLAIKYVCKSYYRKINFHYPVFTPAQTITVRVYYSIYNFKKYSTVYSVLSDYNNVAVYSLYSFDRIIQ